MTSRILGISRLASSPSTETTVLNVVRVPNTALIFGEHGIRVATIEGNNQIAFKTVRPGQDIGSEIEILSGLSADDRVVDARLKL